jgi:two-component system chemotaxis response regulator CheY
MKALVVDDSSVMRKVLTGALGRVEITDVDEAVDGQEAIDKASANGDYDVILMDWNMPNKTGLEAVQEIRAAGKTMPIIMVTTEAEKDRVLEAVKAGASSYIIKPFSPQSIVEKLKEVLKG